MPEDRSLNDFADALDTDSQTSNDDSSGNEADEHMELVSLEQWERDSESSNSWLKKAYERIRRVLARIADNDRRWRKGESRCLYIDINQWKEHSETPDRHPKKVYNHAIRFRDEGTRIKGDELRYDHRSRCLLIRHDEIITVKHVPSCRTPVQRATILSVIRADRNGVSPITDLCGECGISVDELKDIVRAERGNKEVKDIPNKNYYTEQTEKSDEDWTLEDVHSLDCGQFEHLVSYLWSDNGYRTTVTSGSNDQGIDVIAENNSERVAIQAKQYSRGNKVGNRVIRNTAGVLPRGFDRVIIVTSSSFTEPAKKEAQEYGKQVRLINSRLLLHELNRSDLKPDYSINS